MGRATKARGMIALDQMNASYESAKRNGDREEEAKWANQIGHAWKDKGEYVKALDWFRRDYETSRLVGGTLMPTCQSIGEMYLRLQNHEEALKYQHKHFALAEADGDVVEQQRASTQLGRTYLELFETKEVLSGLADCQGHFKTSLDLAKVLRANSSAGGASKSTFVVELVDAYNNVGLARALAEDFGQAFEYYKSGLKLCDDENVYANDAARSRIHHNLGRLYGDLREWESCKKHTQIDIQICQNIPHPQGEAKGLMNLADVHFKSREYDQADRCYKRALHIVRTLEDEDNLNSQIKSNIDIVGQARAKSKTFDAQMKGASKFRKDVEAAKGTAGERNLIKQECKLLQDLIGLAEELQAWDVHLGLAKRLKKLTRDLGDRERLGDALEIVATSYYNIRKFDKAMKWHRKAFEECKRIGHLEGQIVAKINCGNALDASGRSRAALKAYQEAFEAAKSSNSPKMLDQQISALENVHYCFLVRLEDGNAAGEVKVQLDELKRERSIPEGSDDGDERCSETSGEENSEGYARGHETPERSCDHHLLCKSRGERFPQVQSQRSKIVVSDSEEEDDNVPLASLMKTPTSLPCKRKSVNVTDKSKCDLPIPHEFEKRKRRMQTNLGKDLHISKPHEPKGPRTIRRKRVISDDEEIEAPMQIDVPHTRPNLSTKGSVEVVEDSGNDDDLNDTAVIGVKRKIPSFSRPSAADSIYLSSDEDVPTITRKKVKHKITPMPSSSDDILNTSLHNVDDRYDEDFIPASDFHLPFQNTHIPRPVTPSSLGAPGSPLPVRVTIPSSAQQMARKVFTPTVNMPASKNAKRHDQGEVRISEDTRQQTNISESEVPSTMQNLSNSFCAKGDNWAVNVVVLLTGLKRELVGGTALHLTYFSSSEMVMFCLGCTNTRLLELYMNHCKASAISPSSLLVERLHAQKVSEEVVVAGCNIEDHDALPLLAALAEGDAFSLLDLSHNLLTHATVHAIQELVKSTNQTDLGLTLDLHCNKLGSGALLQICQCPVSLSRLEDLNVSGNRLTDHAARHLSTILKKCQALATLNLESCTLTTRSIIQLTSALHSESPLIKLCVGNNNPIAGLAVQKLLDKLSKLKSFSELDMRGLELDDSAVAGVCTLIKTSKSISSLNLAGTDIRNDGALALRDALDSPLQLTKLDLSSNSFKMEPAVQLCSKLMSIHSLSNVNLSGNHLDHKAVEVIAQGLAANSCRLKVLNLSNCLLGRFAVLHILQSLPGHATLLDLNLSRNIYDVENLCPQPIDCPNGEVSEGQAESTSAKVPLGEQVERSYESVESLNKCSGYLTGEDGKLPTDNPQPVPPSSMDVGFRALPSDETADANVHTAQSGLNNLTTGNLGTSGYDLHKKEDHQPECIIGSSEAAAEDLQKAQRPLETIAEDLSKNNDLPGNSLGHSATGTEDSNKMEIQLEITTGELGTVEEDPQKTKGQPEFSIAQSETAAQDLKRREQQPDITIGLSVTVAEDPHKTKHQPEITSGPSETVGEDPHNKTPLEYSVEVVPDDSQERRACLEISHGILQTCEMQPCSSPKDQFETQLWEPLVEPIIQASPPKVDAPMPDVRLVISQPDSKSARSSVEDHHTASAMLFCEQLAAAIRTAQSLRMLDLSDNELQRSNVEILYIAWSSCPRGASLPQQHVQEGTVHFFVEGRPCPCVNPPCCSLH